MKEIERRAFLKGVGWLVVTLGVLPRLGVKAMGDEMPFAFLGDSLEKTPGSMPGFYLPKTVRL